MPYKIPFQSIGQRKGRDHCTGESAMQSNDIMEIWNEIKKFVELNPGVYLTRPLTNSLPTPFTAENINGRIRITMRSGNSGYLKDEDFPSFYSLHQRRERGEKVSKEAGKVNQRQVYFYSLIYWCHDRKQKPVV